MSTAAPLAPPPSVRPGGRSRLLWWVPALAVAGSIFLLSAWSAPPTPGVEIPGLDKCAHAALYATLAATIYLGLRRAHAAPERRAVALAALLAALYGITDEVHQVFVPLRQADAADWLADVAGALAGAPAAPNVERRFRHGVRRRGVRY